MKSKFLPALFAAGFLLVSTEQKAQVSAYAFTQTLSTYGAPNTGSLVGGTLQDDDVNTVALPFTFTFNGTPYTSIDVCSNGYLSFNSLSGTEYTPISDLSTQDVISPLGNDLIQATVILADMTAGSNTLTNCSSVNGYSVGDMLFDYGGDFSSNPTITSISGSKIVLNQNALNTNTGYDIVGLNGYIKQSVSGTTPNRICEFEFANFARFVIYDEVIKFKVRLYETSNKIEFVYGTVIPGQDATPFEVGLKGNSSSDFNSRKVNSPVTWSASVASSSTSDYCDFDPTVFPANGQSYMWTPSSCTVPVLSVSPSNTTICSGQTLVLTASGATTYSWTNGPASAQNSVTPSSTTSYTIVGANTTCTSSLVYTVNVTASPTLTVAQPQPSICAGQISTLTASGATSYSWNAVSGSSQYTVSPTVTTTYTLTGSNGNCSATHTVVQAVVTAPSPTITANNLAVCPGESAVLTGNGATSYTWTGTGGTVTVVSPTLAAPAGNYTVTASNGAGACSSSAMITIGVANCTAIRETAGNVISGISAYPNPFSTVLYIKNTADKDQSVTISDALGKVLFHADVKAGSTESISSDSLNRGIYFISVKGENGSFTKKLIKE